MPEYPARGGGQSGTSVPDSWLATYGLLQVADGPMLWDHAGGLHVVGTDLELIESTPGSGNFDTLRFITEGWYTVTIDTHLSPSTTADGFVTFQATPTVTAPSTALWMNGSWTFEVKPSTSVQRDIEGLYWYPPFWAAAGDTFAVYANVAGNLTAGSVHLLAGNCGLLAVREPDRSNV